LQNLSKEEETLQTLSKEEEERHKF